MSHRTLIIASILALGALAIASPQAQQAGHQSCVVIQELSSARPLVQRGGCETRLSPASTFKIPHALVALETGVVTAGTVERWDGRRYERQTEWNRDHTVISSLRPSVLWFFQRIAPRIGAERMKGWLNTFEYGNRDVSGPIAEYWVNGRLRVSPLEQVAFLRRFYRGDLPIAAAHLKAVRQGLEQQPGVVHNSLGTHSMPGDWTHATLNAKTGATTTASERVSWLVGLLTTPRSAGRDYVFAVAVWRADNQVETLDAARLAVNTFIAERLLPERAR